jgi:hypothetical protein
LATDFVRLESLTYILLLDSEGPLSITETSKSTMLQGLVSVRTAIYMRNVFTGAHCNIELVSDATVFGAEDETCGGKSPDFPKKPAAKKCSTNRPPHYWRVQSRKFSRRHVTMM